MHFHPLHLVLTFHIITRGERETARRWSSKVLGSRFSESGANNHQVERNGDDGYRLLGGRGESTANRNREGTSSGTTTAQNDDQSNDYPKLCYGRTHHVEQYIMSPIRGHEAHEHCQERDRVEYSRIK